MSHNLADLPPDQREKVDVGLHASGVAYKERYDMPVSIRDVEKIIPEHLRDYFKERLEFYREKGRTLGKLPYEPKEK
ncbi:DNA polymerase III subunit theta [Leminorella grimontii]|uniref:DNA polymerase III subunit theta n=1 Tax=Leminorella grimontii TaxID=82981 RepID=A0AAV5MZE7_9GAMM|nr:DNA polymerase III subunit theta [Leminorella grimontii]KFC95379.1 DNA polymerase III theta subunit [Leminorella grimontii ATCC 33999 = DSM 5078]GKX54053.1 DNA polymerase III subunit theta [Leminorella grimontii]VFS60188.1 DNA polymerase III subunit theta [Leminorella grimontii]